MDDYPQELNEFINDNTFVYGKDFFTCPLITKEQEAQLLIANKTAICCTWMPQIFDDVVNEKIKICDNVGIPVIWQGLPEKYQIYIEPLNVLPSEFLDEYNEALRDDEVRDKYTKSHLNRILNQMKKLKTENNSNILSLRKGALIKLKPSNIPLARSYPMARVRRILKRDFSKNIEIIHVKLRNGKIISVQNSAGFIDWKDIECILCESSDANIQLAMYIKQQLLKSRERQNKMKQGRKQIFDNLLKHYLGEKIKGALNETNFKLNGRKNKQIEVKQEAMESDVYDIFIPSIKCIGIKYNVNKDFLDLNIKTATELSKIIGTKKIMNIKGEYEYFIVYPMTIRYGFKWKFPAFKAIFNIGKANKKGNVER